MKKKSTKTILEKKTKKTMCRNTVAIQSVLKKNYKTKFSTSSILKKKSIKTILNKKHKKKWEKKEKNNFGKKSKKNRKKNMWGNPQL
jgi:hypothetical protein